MKVLLVEDEEAIARPLATLLRAEGWAIETAATAARGYATETGYPRNRAVAPQAARGVVRSTQWAKSGEG